MSTMPEPAADRRLRAVPDEIDSQPKMADDLAERAVLGSMMLSRQACDDVTEVLSSRDFYQPKHAMIYAVLIDLWGNEQPTSPVAVAHRLAEMDELRQAGGAPYLHDLLEAAVGGSPKYFADIVKQWSRRRDAHCAGLRIVQMSQDLSAPVDEVIETAQKTLHEAAVGQDRSVAAQRVSDFSDDEMTYLEQVVEGLVPHGLSSGLGSLDKLLGGFLPGQLIIPAGRPGMGKSTAGLGFAVAVARRGLPSLVVTLEMSKRELWWRLLSRVAQIDLSMFTSGRLDRRDLTKVREAKKIIDSWPLHIDEESNTIAAIRSSARRTHQRFGSLSLTFVDYLQRIKSVGKVDRRDLEVGGWVRELKTLARDLNTVMIVPSQLNRGSEARVDKRPQMSDNRDSGEIEQEADIVLLLHRDDYYDKECDTAGEAQFIVAKHRNGPTDTITVANQLHYSRFTDWDTPEEPFR